MDGLTRSEEFLCPFCHSGNVYEVTQNAEVKTARTSGLLSPRWEGTFKTAITVTVSHRAQRVDRSEKWWACSGVPPKGWVMP